MKTHLIVALLAIIFSSGLQAQTPTLPTDAIKWVSVEPRDIVTIENGTGAKLFITITVDNNAAYPTGISLRNCGRTTRVGPGSSAVCMTSDPTNPVNFSSDSPTNATGTYIIRPQP